MIDNSIINRQTLDCEGDYSWSAEDDVFRVIDLPKSNPSNDLIRVLALSQSELRSKHNLAQSGETIVFLPNLRTNGEDKTNYRNQWDGPGGLKGKRVYLCDLDSWCYLINSGTWMILNEIKQNEIKYIKSMLKQVLIFEICSPNWQFQLRFSSSVGTVRALISPTCPTHHLAVRQWKTL